MGALRQGGFEGVPRDVLLECGSVDVVARAVEQATAAVSLTLPLGEPLEGDAGARMRSEDGLRDGIPEGSAGIGGSLGHERLAWR